MEKAIVANIMGLLISLATFLHIPGVPKPYATPTPAPICSATPAPTTTVSLTPTPTITHIPVPTSSPTNTPTPTINQEAVDACNSLYMPIEMFAGHSCLFEDNNYRWMDSVNGHPATESLVDKLFKDAKSDEIRSMIVKLCMKTTKDHFERCSNSIRDSSGRIIDEMKNKIASDIQNCLNTHSNGGNMQREFTPRFMAKDRLKGKINEIYDFCFSHNDSAADYHP